MIFHWSINRACIVLFSLLASSLPCVLSCYRIDDRVRRGSHCLLFIPLCEHRLGYVDVLHITVHSLWKVLSFTALCFSETVSGLLFIIFITSNCILIKSWDLLLLYMPGKCLQIIYLVFGKGRAKGKVFFNEILLYPFFFKIHHS